MHPKRKTIGIRIPDNKIALDLIEALNEPIMSSTLILPGDDMPLMDPYEMKDILGHQVDLIIDGGEVYAAPSSLIDLTGNFPVVLREGKGDVTPFR